MNELTHELARSRRICYNEATWVVPMGFASDRFDYTLCSGDVIRGTQRGLAIIIGQIIESDCDRWENDAANWLQNAIYNSSGKFLVSIS